LKPLRAKRTIGKAVPLNKRAPAHQRYRIMELQRWREKRGVRLNVHPKFWPFNVEAADHLTVAIVESGANPDQFLRKAFPRVWADERNLADEQTLVMLADGVGLPGQKLLANARARALKKGTRRILKRRSRSTRSARPATRLTARCSGARTASSCWTTH
jgi:2-hydroxychromene-2-carboxylate isomerase